MQIETLCIRNFKALRDIKLKNLPGYCVFVGKNGSGKTTLFRVFAFLKECLASNVRTALMREGGRNGFREVLSRGAGDADIELEIQFRMEISGVERLVTYLLDIGEDPAEGVVVRREVLRYKRGQYGAPFHFLHFENGKGMAITNEEDFDKQEHELDREEQELDNPSTLAVKALGQFRRFKAASALRELIENWHISDFHIGEARGDKPAQVGEHLSASGDNLPSVARNLFENQPDRFESIKRRMRERVPGVSDIEVKIMEDGRLVMSYRDGAFQDPFIDRNVSDGTIKMFAYLVLLEDPKPHAILCIEEPENQLYPELMAVLAEEFLQYSERGGQVFVSTHSPEFLRAVPAGSVYWLEKQDGFTKIFRLQDHATLNAMVCGPDGESPGVLWKRGFLDSRRLGVDD